MAIYQIENGRIEMLMKRKHMVGLAAYLKNGIMQPAGIDRVTEVLQEYNAFLKSFHITEITAFTTAALRNAKNSKDAVAEIVRRTDIPVRVISGDEEAEFDFIGATHSLSDDAGLLIDIGGASTEIVLYKNHEIVKKTSLLVGSLGLHTKYVEDILPSREEVADMRRDIREILDLESEIDGVQGLEICGVGGTIKGTLAIYNMLYGCDKHNKEMDASRLGAIIDRFCRNDGISQEDTILLMKTVPERLNTIIPGMVIADELAQRFDSHRLIYSDSGVREGYIYDQIIKK